MARRVTPSQFKSIVRRAEQKQRQAINDYNQEVNRVNSHNKHVFNDYNRQVRAHNQRVRENRRRLQQELARLQSRSTTRTTIRFVTYQTSVETLQRSFVRFEEASQQERWTADDVLFEMAEGEVANSAAVLNALLDEPTNEPGDDARLRDTIITTELASISPDLDARWKGALFALSPVNPDAARQFCTSVREIFITILDMNASDPVVLAANSSVALTADGRVQRREKIRFCLSRNGQQSNELADFVENDIDNVLELFMAFNPATHGEAGRYDFTQLSMMKRRVEDAIRFLHRIVSEG